MAIMIGGTDWTYDMFMEDAERFSAKPMRGVHCNSNASDREKFMTWLKDCARAFKAEWLSQHKSLYDSVDGWVGNAFANEMLDDIFSDFYKDTYGQRPHLSKWFYVYPIGLPHSEDTARLFCGTNSAVEQAKIIREMLESEVI